MEENRVLDCIKFSVEALDCRKGICQRISQHHLFICARSLSISSWRSLNRVSQAASLQRDLLLRYENHVLVSSLCVLAEEVSN